MESFVWRVALTTPVLIQTRGFRGKAFGTFVKVMPADAPFTIQLCNNEIVFLPEVTNGSGSATNPWGRLNIFIFDKVTTRKRNAFTAHEASLKLGGTYDIHEQAVTRSPLSTSQWYNI